VLAGDEGLNMELDMVNVRSTTQLDYDYKSKVDCSGLRCYRSSSMTGPFQATLLL
jgi:hypothetical protein